jgi:hypothetical protein
MGLFPESESELARQITHALGDQTFDPLDELQERGPEDCHYFSDLETSLSEWSFACGIAWTFVRMRDPLASPELVVEAVQRLAREGWRAHAGPRSWAELVGHDRDERGQVRRDPQTQLEQFNEGLGKMTVRRAGEAAQPGEATSPNRPASARTD